MTNNNNVYILNYNNYFSQKNIYSFIEKFLYLHLKYLKLQKN